jgi:hypothetical protein
MILVATAPFPVAATHVELPPGPSESENPTTDKTVHPNRTLLPPSG